MNSLPRTSDSAAEEQASLWAARLEGGTLSAADRDALDTWLNADTAHRPLLSCYCQFSADLEEQLLALVATGGVQLPPEPEFEAAASSARVPARRAKIISFFAATTLAAAAAVVFALWPGRARTENISTGAAHRQSLTLEDGTRVELNARTTLAVELTRAERHVKLTAGEAFFTVAKDKARPFIIDTPAGSVRVTGTVFDVRAESPAELAVTVVEGSVQVRPTGATEPFALGANDQLIAGAAGVTKRTLAAGDLDATLAWRQGQIVLDGVPLQDVLARFARYHDRKIIPSSGLGARNKTVGGRCSLDDLDGFLHDLETSHGVRITHEANGTIRVALPDEP